MVKTAADEALEALTESEPGLDLSQTFVRTQPSSDGIPKSFVELDEPSQHMVHLALGQNSILERIASGVPLAESMADLLRFLERDVPEMFCSVLLLDEEGTRLWHCAAPRLPAEYCALINGAEIGPRGGSCGTAAYLGSRFVATDIETEPAWQDYRELAMRFGLRACWSTPILNEDGRVLGTFAMYFKTPRSPEPLHERIIEVALHVAAVAIGKDQQEKESHRLTNELKERVKELTLLRRVAQALLVPRPLGQELFDDLVAAISSGWLPPELCQVRIVYEKWESKTKDFIETPYQLNRPLVTNKGSGCIQIVCMNTGGAEVSLQLLDALAESMVLHFNHAHAEEALRESEERYRLVNLATSDVVWDWDVKNGTLWWNEGVSVVFGYQPSEVSSELTWWAERVHPEDRDRVHDSLQLVVERGNQAWQEDYRFLKKDGSYADIQDRGYAMRNSDGVTRRIIGVMQDVTARRKAGLEVRELAYHEPLTRLPNRTALTVELAKAIENAAIARSGLSLLLVNLNYFRDINDSLGHQNGDILLQQVAARLLETVGEQGQVASLGGDEFAILLPRIHESAEVENVLSEIHVSLQKPVLLADIPIKTDATLGVALYPEHGSSVDLLWQHADVALRTAKERYEPHVVYSSSIDHYDPGRLILLGELSSAIENDQLVLHYQPKIDLKKGRTIGLEALVRWQHPTRGLIFPDAFIPLAERTGLINPLTTCVVASALRQGLAFLQQGIELDISVNLSARNLHEPGFSKGLLALVGDIGFPLTRLTLEVTETGIMADPVRAKAVLTELCQAGIHLSMDDFGIGQSSLSYLKELPISKIKIDKSFVMDFEQPRNMAVVRSAIDLASNMGLQITAEGVEQEVAAQALKEFGCDLAQGYFYSKPLPVPLLTTWLKESAWGL